MSQASAIADPVSTDPRSGVRRGSREPARESPVRGRITPRSPPPSLRFADHERLDGPEVELRPGEITLVEGGRGIESVRHRLVLDAAQAGSCTVQVVGEERLDTTGLVRRAQARGLDPGYVLRSSVLARAFTAYQLSVLLEERLPESLEAEDAAASLVLDPLRLYTDEDVRTAEARRLTRQALDRLTGIAEDFEVPLVVMQPPRRARRQLTRMLREAADTRVLVQTHPGTGNAQSGRTQPAYTVHLPGEEATYRLQDPRPRQSRLDRFHDGPNLVRQRGEARG